MKNSIRNISIKNINKCSSISEILKLNSIKFPKKVFIYDHTSEKIKKKYHIQILIITSIPVVIFLMI